VAHAQYQQRTSSVCSPRQGENEKTLPGFFAAAALNDARKRPKEKTKEKKAKEKTPGFFASL
jgi:hypothetical protein